MEARAKELAAFDEQLKASQTEMDQVQGRVEMLARDIKQHRDRQGQLVNQREEMRKQLKSRNDEIAQLTMTHKQELDDARRRYRQLHGTVKALRAQVTEAAMKITNKEHERLQLQQEIEFTEAEHAELFAKLNAAQVERDKLQSLKLILKNEAAEKKPSLTDVASPQSNSVGERLGFRDETASAMPTLDDLPTLPAAAVTAVSVPPSTATTTTSRATLLRGRALSTISVAGSNHSSTQEAASTMLSPRKRAYRDAMRTEQFQSQRKHVDFDALKPGAEIKLLYQNPKTQHIDAYTARVTDTYNDTDDSAVTAAERRGRLVFVHYHGWNQRFDEWVDASSVAVGELTSAS